MQNSLISIGGVLYELRGALLYKAGKVKAAPGQMSLFDESKHHRDNDGKFASNPGSGGDEETEGADPEVEKLGQLMDSIGGEDEIEIPSFSDRDDLTPTQKYKKISQLLDGQGEANPKDEQWFEAIEAKREQASDAFDKWLESTDESLTKEEYDAQAKLIAKQFGLNRSIMGVESFADMVMWRDMYNRIQQGKANA